MLSKKVLLHHDNACPHTAAVTVDSATTGLLTSTSSLTPGFGAKQLSHLRSSEGGIARSWIHSRRGSEGSGAHLALRAAKKILLCRNTETS